MSSVRWENRWLYVASACLIAASLGLSVWTWTNPVFIPNPSTSDLSSNSNVVESRASTKVQSEILFDESIWKRPLQYGFRDISPIVSVPQTLPPVTVQPPVATTQAVKDLGLRLVGTVVETGRSMAIVIDRQGKLDFCNEGEELQLEPSGIRIDSVKAESVVILFQGKSRIWFLGQALTMNAGSMNEGPMDAKQTLPSPTLEPAIPAAKTKMSIEEELERINRGDRPI